LKRGWTQFWRGGSTLLLACIPAHALAQQLNSPRKTETNVSTAATQRNDELSLAGLRPGRDDMTKAERLFRKPSATKYDGTNKIWQDPCRHQLLSIIPDPNGTIQEVRVAQTNASSNSNSSSNANSASTEPCASAAESHSRWVTGHGLVIGDACSRVVALYGQPGSRGPSTKDGQQLELLYYAFDWAGPDVPQVMAVLCTPERNAKPGRVVEITLAAPSL
jgi:hypothetical protein